MFSKFGAKGNYLSINENNFEVMFTYIEGTPTSTKLCHTIIFFIKLITYI